MNKAASKFTSATFGIAFALMVQGCSTTCIVTLKDANGSDRTHSVGTVHGRKLYIEAEADPPQPPQIGSSGLHDVKIKATWWHDFLGVLTLGLYRPFEVEYHNLKPAADATGTFGPRRPSENP